MDIYSLHPLMPEIVLALLGLCILMLELTSMKKEYIALTAMTGTLAALYFLRGSSGVLFDGMYQADGYSNYFKLIFFLNLFLSILISIKYLEVEKSSHGEFYALMVFATIGMMIMASAENMIVLYVGLELMSLSTYVLAGFLRHDSRSTESAVKYLLMGAFSTAILLYGIALSYGSTGTMDFQQIGLYINSHNLSGNPVVLLSLVLIMVSFSFKVAAAPFHMWAPDVYEGAPTPVTAFMSIGPKAAGFAVLGKVLVMVFPSLRSDWTSILIVISVLTMLTGNVMALVQTNIKRMLAYSSIAHAGYLLLGLIPGNYESFAGMMNYLFIYLFMNVGAFAVIISLRSAEFMGDEIRDYAGLAKTHPVMASLMLVFMFALAGIPPTAGFIGKFYIFSELVKSNYIWLTIAGVMFSVVSAFYYLRVVMYMYMRPPEREVVLETTPPLNLALFIAFTMIILIGVLPQAFISHAKNVFFTMYQSLL
ncbi:MAG: NADH-quinone oxidoreductase subunit N [Nitrospirae bacterium]|nr:NADH-quinone oxidoreductase subunit N [Nitrospirota bacterium]